MLENRINSIRYGISKHKWIIIIVKRPMRLKSEGVIDAINHVISFNHNDEEYNDILIM